MVRHWQRLALTVTSLAVGAAAGHWVKSSGEGIGYQLGLWGGIMMLFILIYPLVKHTRLGLRFKLKNIFWFHVIIGTLGPAIIMAHSRLHLEALNSKVAFFNMLALVVTGSATLYTRTNKDGSIQEIVGKASRLLLKFHSPIVWGFVITALFHVLAVHMY